MEGMAAGTVTAVGAEAGLHGVEVRVPQHRFKGVSCSWYPTVELAREQFAKTVDHLRQGPGSALYKVTLIENRRPVRHEIVARVLHNRL